MENLWPENLTVTGTKAPVIILREQASLLGEATQNIVEAEVKNADPSPDMRGKENDTGFRCFLYCGPGAWQLLLQAFHNLAQC